MLKIEANSSKNNGLVIFILHSENSKFELFVNLQSRKKIQANPNNIKGFIFVLHFVNSVKYFSFYPTRKVSFPFMILGQSSCKWKNQKVFVVLSY